MNSRIYSIVIILFVFYGHMGWSQSGISLYHMNNGTFQGNHMNASYIPNGKVFVGLPVISGITVDVNSPFSYNDAIFRTGEVDSLDIDQIISTANENNYLGLEAEISTFYLGFRTSNTSAISLFVRERIGARVFFSDDLLGFAWNGNKGYVGETLDASTTIADVRYYREYGLGFWKRIPKQNFEVGVRVKLLNGMVSAISDRNFNGNIDISDNNSEHTLNVSNTRFNTAGLDLLGNGTDSEIQSHLISNGNLGVGLDLGVNWKLNEYFSIAASVNDLGYINWKTNTQNYAVADTSFTFSGLDLADVDNIEQAVEDSLVDRLNYETLNDSFRSGLNTNAFLSGAYHLTKNDQFTATIATSVVQDRFRMLYAVGYTRKFGNVFSVSANVIRKPQQGIDGGLAFAASLGGIQLYMASDQLVRAWNVPEAKSVDLRFGINLIFGKTKEVKDDRKDLQHTGGYSGKNRKIEKSDGIYWIVKKKKPRPIYNDDPKFSDR